MQLAEGINVEPNTHVQVLQNRLAMATINEAQMEAAIQQLLAENQQLRAMIPKDGEVGENASAATEG